MFWPLCRASSRRLPPRLPAEKAAGLRASAPSRRAPRPAGPLGQEGFLRLRSAACRNTGWWSSRARRWRPGTSWWPSGGGGNPEFLRPGVPILPYLQMRPPPKRRTASKIISMTIPKRTVTCREYRAAPSSRRIPSMIIQDEKYATILCTNTCTTSGSFPTDSSPHPKNYWAWDGDSRGRWDGDTLRRRREQLQRHGPGSTWQGISSTRTSTWSSASRSSIPTRSLYEATVDRPDGVHEAVDHEADAETPSGG